MSRARNRRIYRSEASLSVSTAVTNPKSKLFRKSRAPSWLVPAPRGADVAQSTTTVPYITLFEAQNGSFGGAHPEGRRKTRRLVNIQIQWKEPQRPKNTSLQSNTSDSHQQADGTRDNQLPEISFQSTVWRGTVIGSAPFPSIRALTGATVAKQSKVHQRFRNLLGVRVVP